MNNTRTDLFFCELLRKFYETKIEPNTDYMIPFEFLYEEELIEMYNSFNFKIFKLRYNTWCLMKKIGEFLTL